ncbi:hypothetical protein LTR37_005488 [Vermiconidia calcicola]|uniref:Uncharacterized protein n=1 Tax=Vermiconidia calcicola TaxID=1690605 RepID=A0ACC3NKS5_9PEZI|nr:hypothetical protein LTR37_005488 [Vermiconidia calcicola]
MAVPTSATRDHSQTLEVEINATQRDISKAYRKLALQFHPDKGGDAEKFKLIGKANDILGDPKERAQYHRTNSFGQYAAQGSAASAGDDDHDDDEAVPEEDEEFQDEGVMEDGEGLTEDDGSEPDDVSGSEYDPANGELDEEGLWAKSYEDIDLEEEGGTYVVDMGDGEELTVTEHNAICSCFFEGVHKLIDS